MSNIGPHNATPPTPPTPPTPVTLSSLTLTFTDGKVTARRVPDGDIGAGEFTLSADGKTIDAVGTSKNYKGNLYRGILKIEGDTLTLARTGSHSELFG